MNELQKMACIAVGFLAFCTGTSLVWDYYSKKTNPDYISRIFLEKIYSDTLRAIPHENQNRSIDTISAAKVDCWDDGTIELSSARFKKKYVLKSWSCEGVRTFFVPYVIENGVEIKCNTNQETAEREDRNHLYIIDKIKEQKDVGRTPYTKRNSYLYYIYR
jgi:hypothetical protein